MPEDSLEELKKAKVLADIGFSVEVLSRMQKHLEDPENSPPPTKPDVEIVKRTMETEAWLAGFGGGVG